MTSLPGLHLSSVPTEALAAAPEVQQTRTFDLNAGSEFRFEVAFFAHLTIKLLTGTAEYFGSEFAPNQTYTFSGAKGAVYTWHGCKIEVGGESESEYTAEETQMSSYANAHFGLENLREQTAMHGDMGPRVLVVGPENAGKTSLVKILTAYAVKAGRQPVVVNLDPRQGMLSPPGSFSATAFSSILDVEEGWGSSPISGPSPIPVKMPLVYHYGLPSPEEGKLFKPLVTRMALAVTSRLEEDKLARQAGFIIDTAGAMAHGKGGVYENIEHIVSEFSVNVLLVLSSERLYSDLTRKYAPSTVVRPTDDAPPLVIRLDKSGGCVDRSDTYMRTLRETQIKQYFFGSGDAETALAPTSNSLDFSSISLFQIPQTEVGNGKGGLDFKSGAQDDDEDIFGKAATATNNSAADGKIYNKIEPSGLVQNKLLAVTSASAGEKQEAIRDSSVLGYVYVSDVDEERRKIRVLAPQPGAVPGSVFLVGRWPEDVAALVS